NAALGNGLELGGDVFEGHDSWGGRLSGRSRWDNGPWARKKTSLEGTAVYTVSCSRAACSEISTGSPAALGFDTPHEARQKRPMDAETRERIARAIENNDVLLFLKGTRQAPQCGFSARTVEILDSLLPEYATVDVLAHPEIRDGIKEYSSWPTIPQLYIRGEFIGGSDIVTELFEAGELQKKLGFDDQVEPPELTVTERAAEALRGAAQGADELVCLEIDKDFQPGLSVGPARPTSIIVESNGVRIALDRLSAGRANGVTIDYVDTP